MCITTIIQDAILLLDIQGRLFVNLNDAGSRHCTNFIRKIVSGYSESYLLSLSGYGDGDSIGFFDENGRLIDPTKKHKIKVGEQLGIQAKSLGVNNVIPFSSMHKYQRSDSIWANEYITPIDSYEIGIPNSLNYIPPFIYLDCSNGTYELIKPDPVDLKTRNCKEFGDNWADELDKSDKEVIENYFKRKEKIRQDISFINFKVGGRDNFFKFESKKKKGITFEVPRNSLIKALNLQIFDDLLIGNFMKTTLHGMQGIYEGDFAFYLAKYADNGRAETLSELESYFRVYQQRAGIEYIYQSFLDKSKDIFTRFVADDRGSFIYKKAKKIYYYLK